MSREYTFLFQYSLIAWIVSSLLACISFLLVYQKPDSEKMSVYECGFNPYGHARNKFEVKFYIVGILFIIFDLEVCYIFPWAVAWWQLNSFGIIVMYFFIFMLIVGFLFEFKLGIIDICVLTSISLNKLEYKYIYLFFYISTLLAKYIYGFVMKRTLLGIFIRDLNIIFFLTILKKNEVLLVSSLLDIVVVDLLKIRNHGRFLVNYIFLNYVNQFRICVKIFNDGVMPIYSIQSLYKSSDWLEREVWDMYGLKFLFHGNLRRILTDYGFKGHPLRKDFPLIGYVDMYYNELFNGLALGAVEITQLLRFYDFENPWNKWTK